MKEDKTDASRPRRHFSAEEKVRLLKLHLVEGRPISAIGFADAVRVVCRLAYRDAGAGGRPGIDPVAFFKMLMIGFFENLPCEQVIASRWGDSLSLRTFLGYDPGLTLRQLRSVSELGC